MQKKQKQKTKKTKNNNAKSIVMYVAISLLIAFGIFMLSYNNLSQHIEQANQLQLIDDFFQREDSNYEDDFELDENQIIERNSRFIAVIEIPQINLMRGLFPIGSRYNHVDRNLEILVPSAMPNIDGGLLTIAGHSGSANISFFRHLDRLQEGDYVFVYYNQIKYIYEVFRIERQERNGILEVVRNFNYTELLLTTCDPRDDYKQLLVMARLVWQEYY